MQIWPRLSIRRLTFEWQRGCRRDLHAVRMSRWCTNSMRHWPSACAALRRSAACVRPGPKARRETRDANAEEATGEKQLLRLERPFQTAGPTYNVIQNARGFLTKQVMRCRARLTAPLGRAQPPLSTTPYQRPSHFSHTRHASVASRLHGKRDSGCGMRDGNT